VAKEPETDEGKIAEIVISLWSLCVAGIVIGLIAGLPITNALSNATADGKEVSNLDVAMLRKALFRAFQRGDTLDVSTFQELMFTAGRHLASWSIVFLPLMALRDAKRSATYGVIEL